MQTETIAAISTPPGLGGIGIIRISGEQAVSIAERIFYMPSGKKLGNCPSHTIHYGHICNNGQTVDEVLLMLMRSPHSYTTEDTVEINCHGGAFVVQKVLEAAIQNGARPAEPGEFTKRAFLNGRIDLSQAEAVIDLIQSQNEYAWKASLGQLKGNVSKKIEDLRKKLLYQIAFLESALDDPEHISLEGFADTLLLLLKEYKGELKQLILSFENGRRMTEGIKTVIIGKPNAGKSSILNLLAGEERAIVTDVEGTTRDVLEEHVILDGISLRILDTAGIRSTEDVVERLGVERALYHIKDADMILYIIDAFSGLDENDRNIWPKIEEKEILVLINKTDLAGEEEEWQKIFRQLPERFQRETPIYFSAKEGKGLSELTAQIKERFFAGTIGFNDQITITNVRHKRLLEEALQSFHLVEESIENGMPEDFYSIDLMEAYGKLGQILGEEIEDDLANEIFQRFCMGK